MELMETLYVVVCFMRQVRHVVTIKDSVLTVTEDLTKAHKFLSGEAAAIAATVIQVRYKVSGAQAVDQDRMHHVTPR